MCLSRLFSFCPCVPISRSTQRSTPIERRSISWANELWMMTERRRALLLRTAHHHYWRATRTAVFTRGPILVRREPRHSCLSNDRFRRDLCNDTTFGRHRHHDFRENQDWTPGPTGLPRVLRTVDVGIVWWGLEACTGVCGKFLTVWIFQQDTAWIRSGYGEDIWLHTCRPNL